MIAGLFTVELFRSLIEGLHLGDLRIELTGLAAEAILNHKGGKGEDEAYEYHDSNINGTFVHEVFHLGPTSLGRGTLLKRNTEVEDAIFAEARA